MCAMCAMRSVLIVKIVPLISPPTRSRSNDPQFRYSIEPSFCSERKRFVNRFINDQLPVKRV